MALRQCVAAGSCVLLVAVMAQAVSARAVTPAEPRWTSSFSPLEAGFSIDLPVRERRWMRATELQSGFEGFTCRDAEKQAIYSVIFGRPARPWTEKDARAFLEGVAELEPVATIEPLVHQGRFGLELAALTKTRTTRYRVLMDGPRVVVASVITPAEGTDTERFFRSLAFGSPALERSGATPAATSLALGR